MIPTLIVPARLASTRLPRKLLRQVRGKPLVLAVAERIRSQVPELPLWFAVDDASLAAALEPEGFRCIMTRVDHVSGTDRIEEANRTIGASHVINIQADEPLVTRRQILALADLLDRGFDMATLACRFRRAADLQNPNQVKVVAGVGGAALYFSRAVIPHPRGLPEAEFTDAWVEARNYLRHLGLYAYTAELLRKFTSWPPGALENLEKLEQLRVLENCGTIGLGLTDEPTIGIDTEEDLAAYEALAPE